MESIPLKFYVSSIVALLLLLFFNDSVIFRIPIIILLLCIFMQIGKYINSRPNSPHGRMYERFSTQCNDCVNPFVIPQLTKIIDPTHTVGQADFAKQIEVQPITSIPVNVQQNDVLVANASISSDVSPSFQKMDQQSTTVQTSNNWVSDPQFSVCQALNKAGFDPNWKKETIDQMLQNQQGRDRLQRMNDQVLKMTGMKSLTNQEITNCYPNYIQEYICRKSYNNQNDQIQQLKTQLQKQQNQIDSLSKFLVGNYPLEVDQLTQTANQTPNREPINFEQNAIDNMTQQNKTSTTNSDMDRTTTKTNDAKCNLNDIATQINSEVEKYYQSAFDTLSKQNPRLSDVQLKQIKSQYGNLTKIIQSKALLEFKQLADLYNNKTNDQWVGDLVTRKTFSVRGHLVNGTDFYIPWKIFDKHADCFGHVR